jgi:hypothetical protein
MMKIRHSPTGSVWRRWDLHLHSPGTKLSNHYGTTSPAVWNQYIEFLENSDVAVFGITDYFSFDNYVHTVDLYEKTYPDGKKIFFPNIEFRLVESIGPARKNVHCHVIFDNNKDICPQEKITQFLSELETSRTRNGSYVRCSELETVSDFESTTVHFAELKKKLNKIFPDETAYLIVTAASGDDGLQGVETGSPRSVTISDELDKGSDAFFGSSKHSEWFLEHKRYDRKIESEAKPVFSGSDAHSFADLERLTGDVPNYNPTWIKSDLTFRGLRQTLFEPRGRVLIGDRPAVLTRQDREATRFIAAVKIRQIDGYSGTNGTWFDDVEIPFNPELTAIIGNKGSGKSAIADIVGLLGESRQYAYFSFLTNDSKNKKFLQARICGELPGPFDLAERGRCHQIIK